MGSRLILKICDVIFFGICAILCWPIEFCWNVGTPRTSPTGERSAINDVTVKGQGGGESNDSSKALRCQRGVKNFQNCVTTFMNAPNETILTTMNLCSLVSAWSSILKPGPVTLKLLPCIFIPIFWIYKKIKSKLTYRMFQNYLVTKHFLFAKYSIKQICESKLNWNVLTRLSWTK